MIQQMPIFYSDCDESRMPVWCDDCDGYHADIDNPEPRGMFNGSPGAIIWPVLMVIGIVLAAAAWSCLTHRSRGNQTNTVISAPARSDLGADTATAHGERKGSPRVPSPVSFEGDR